MTRHPDGSVTLTADEAKIARAGMRCYTSALNDAIGAARRLDFCDVYAVAKWTAADTLRADLEATS